MLVVDGETILALVMRYCDFVLRGALLGVTGRSLDGGIADNIDAEVIVCGDSWLSPKCTRAAMPMFASMTDAAWVYVLAGLSAVLFHGWRGL